MQPSAIRCSLALLVASSSLTACNRRLFEHVDNVCVRTIREVVRVPTDKAADILIVVDNSASMAEEQANLVKNFLNQDPTECPLQDLADVPDEYQNPVRALYTDGGVLSRCGFIQLLAAFDNDFRVGVITTDVNVCDNVYGQGGASWGFHPQRGCLQADAAPGAGGHKIIAATDLEDGDDADDDFAARFAATLANIQTFGSPFERGLDAVDLFFNAPAGKRGPGCEDDVLSFRREQAALVVIFLTDEEDCSHGRDAKLEQFGDEAADERCGEWPTDPDGDGVPAYWNGVPTDRCYDNRDDLSPVESYVDALRALDPDVKVAVIAGGVGEAGNIMPSGCLVGADGAPVGGDVDGDGDNDSCFESGGLSNFTSSGPSNPCGPDTAEARGDLPCCVADGGSRYYQLAELLGSSATDSICNASFRATMLDIAAFIAAVDQVALAEPPANPSAIIVELTRAGSSTVETVAPLPAGADCAAADGWLLVDERFIQLCGSARPGPGDTIAVAAAGSSSAACDIVQQ